LQCSRPPNKLTKNQDNKIKIKWCKEHQESFDTLRDRLIKAPVLSHFHENNRLALATDASIRVLGAVLEQHDQYGNVHPIGYAFRKVLDTEQTYSFTTLELLGLVYVNILENFYTVESSQSIVTTFHYSRYYKTLKSPHS